MEKMNRNLKTTIKRLVIVGMILFLIMSALPTMVADPDVTITINFKDQTGDFTPGNERVYIDGYGYKSDGDTISVPDGKTIYYRAYYKVGSGLYGLKLPHTCNVDGVLDVMYRTVEMDFEDQDGDLTIPPATGNERVYIDYVGYKADGDDVRVPQDSTVRYRAYYKAGSGLYGNKLTELVDAEDELLVSFITFDVEFTPGLAYTGNERVYIDYIGYKSNGADVTVPKDSIIRYRMYYKAGSGLYGSKGSVVVDDEDVVFNPNFQNLGVNFVDQNGNDLTSPTTTGNERAYVDYVGYKADGDTLVVPDDAMLRYRGYYKAGSGLYGNKYTVNVDDYPPDSFFDVFFSIVDVNFIDQYGDDLTSPPATGNERTYIDYIGYKSQDAQVVVPQDCTLRYRAYYKAGSGLYGDKVSTNIGTTIYSIDVKFKIIEVNLKDQDGEPELRLDGAQTGNERVYVDYIGYVADGAELVVPLNSVLRNRAYYRAGSGLYGLKDNDLVVTCTWDVLNVEYKRLTLVFVDQDGNDIGAGNERVYIDYVGYKMNGDVIQVPVGSTFRYRAYYKSGSGLYGQKEQKTIDCTFDVIEVKFKRIKINFVGTCEFTGNERVYLDYVGYKVNDDEIIVPLDCTLRYRAYYKAGSGLYGAKLTKLVDCGWDVLDVNFWSVKFRVEQSTVLVSGAQIYVDYVGYIANDGIVTVPLGSTVRFKGKVGSTWSIKYNKLVEKKWNLAIIEWDGNVFSGPTYMTQIKFVFRDQFGNDVDGISAGTGNERVQVNYIGYFKHGESITKPMGTSLQYRGQYIQDSTSGPWLWTQALITCIKFKTVTFKFVDQFGNEVNGVSAGTGNEEVQVNYIGYFKHGDSLTLPMNSAIQYCGQYKHGGTSAPWLWETINCDEDPFIIKFKTVTFKFVDQFGNEVNGVSAGTGNEEVQVNYIGYFKHGDSLTLPMNSAIQYCGQYKHGGTSAPWLWETINCDEDPFIIKFKTVTFTFKDQDNNDVDGTTAGTGNEEVQVNYIGYFKHGDTITLPMNSAIQYRGQYKHGGTSGPWTWETIDCDETYFYVYFWTVQFFVVDSSNNPISGAQVQINYVKYVDAYTGEKILFPVGSSIQHRAKVGSVSSSWSWSSIDKTWTTLTYVWDGNSFSSPTRTYNLYQLQFVFVDQGGCPLPTTHQRIIISGVSGYKTDGYTMTVSSGQSISYTPYFKSSYPGNYVKGTTQTFTWAVGQAIRYVEFHRVQFKFEDQYGNDLGTSNHRINLDNIGWRANGAVEYLPLGSSVKYYAAYSSSYPGSNVKGSWVTYNADSTVPIEIIDFHRVTFKFEDQFGTDLGTSQHRISITNLGWRANGAVEYLPLGSSVQYYAAYSSSYPGSNVKGSWVTYDADSTVPIEIVDFHRVRFRFTDQYGNEIMGTQHRINIDDIGWRANGAVEYLPLGSSVQYYAAYSSSYPGSNVKGPWVTYDADSTVPVEIVDFHRVKFIFKDQYGNDVSGTTRRINIKDIGWCAHGAVEYLPKGSTISYYSAFSSSYPGSNVIGPWITYTAESCMRIERVYFHKVEYKFEDQDGNDLGVSQHRINIKDIGWRANHAIDYLPLDSTIQYYAAYSSSYPGSNIKGPWLTYDADSTVPVEIVEFHRVKFKFVDQLSDLGVTQHRINIENIGWRANGAVVYLPKDSTIKYQPRYSSSYPGSNIRGTWITYNADSTTPVEIVNFWTLRFRVVYQGTSNLVPGAQVQVDNVGYVNNDDIRTFPIGSSIKHRAKVGTAYSSYATCTIDTSFNTIIWEYDGASFYGPTYDTEVWMALLASDDSPISGATTRYYKSGWKTFGAGTTDSNGISWMKIPDATYNFRVSYCGASQEKYQNIGPDKYVIFRTELVSMSLVSSTNAQLAGGAQYYASGWKTFGSGTTPTSMQLLPLTYNFRVSYGGVSQEKYQNVGSNPNVVFNTKLVTMKLLDSTNDELAGGAQYYGSGWKTFGGGTTTTTMELLPLNYNLRISYGGASQEKYQNVGSDPMVIFNTINVNFMLTTNGMGDMGGYWPMETGSGSTAFDATPNNLDGTIHGAIWTTGKIGNGLSFDGNDYVDLGNTLSYTGAFSVAAWVNPSSIASDRQVISKGYDGTSTQWEMKTSTADGKVDFRKWTSGGAVGATSAKKLTVNTWTHLVGTYDGTTWKIYWDGVFDGQKVASGPVTTGKPAYIGAVYHGGTGNPAQHWKGLLDEVMVFNKALTPTEISNLYASGVSGLGTQLAGGAQYYASGWKTFGSGTTTATMELLPLNYNFRVSYVGASQEKYQNVGSDPNVVFKTELVSMSLVSSTSTALAGGAQYYAGGWKTFGSGTTTATMELLPLNYNFRISYGGVSQEKYQNVGSDPNVVFNTIQVTMKLLDHDKSNELAGDAQYYGGGWKTFGSGTTTTTMEMLPLIYNFRVSYGGASKEMYQNVGSNPVVEFQTGQVHSTSGDCTQYYASGWKTFTQNMELLPVTYNFRYPTYQKYFAIAAGTTTNID